MKNLKLKAAVFAVCACVLSAAMLTGCGLESKAIAVFEQEVDTGVAMAESSMVYYFFEDNTWELTAKAKALLTTKEIPMYAGTYTCLSGTVTAGDATLELIKTKEVEDIEVESIADAFVLAFSTPKLVELTPDQYVTKTGYSTNEYFTIDSNTFKRTK